MAPLLSICIPTYNRAHFLRVMLEALLPQAAAFPGAVEVCVLDNASTDATPQVLEAARRLAPLRCVRNATNIGPNRNIIKGPVELAAGEFVWVLGDHNLMMPDALARILAALAAHGECDALYANFRCATYPAQWPAQAPGGYSGPFSYLANPLLQDRSVRCWHELLRPESALCTQVYAHIVRTRVWRDYWAHHAGELGADFSNVLSTFPHTCTIAETLFGQPSYYIGEPVLTIFNGAQSWGALHARVGVDLRGYPELIRLFQRLGWRRELLFAAQAWGAEQARTSMTEAFRVGPSEERRCIAEYLWKYWHYKGTVLAIWQAFVQSQCCWLARWLSRGGALMTSARQYFFFNCRPARWIRERGSRRSALSQL